MDIYLNFKEPLSFKGPVKGSLGEDTLLNITIPPGMVEELETFRIGSLMKIKCVMVCRPRILQLCLTGRKLAYISNVEVLVE
jgi:hypothetical protein